MNLHSRDKKVWLAAGSSLVSRGGGLALQVLAFPVIIRVLGVERFGIFSLVSSILGFMAFAQFGIGSYVTLKIAQLLPSGNYDAIRRLTWTAVITVGGLALLIASALGLSAQCYGLEWLWGAAYVQNSSVLIWGFYCVLIIGWLTLLLNSLAGCQAGYQELHIGNLYAGLGNLVATIGLVSVGLWSGADERWFWAVLYGLPLIVLLANVVHLMRRHSELKYRSGAIDVKLVSALLTSGAGFMIVQTLLPVLQREGSRLALAHTGNLTEVAHLSVFLQISMITGGFIIIFTQPLYGAISDAKVRGDFDWIRARLGNARVVSLLGCLLVCLVSYCMGPLVLRLWLGEKMSFGSMECLFYALYFSATISVHINQVFLLAANHLRSAVIASLFEMIVLLFSFFVAEPKTAGMVLLLMSIVQVFTSLPVSFLALRGMKGSG
jgi:O-antigen/teichoic acid export membrane protein